MSETMVMRVAKAIAADMEGRLPERVRLRWEDCSDGVKAAMVSRALAALKAMREPTEGMAVAGIETGRFENGDWMADPDDAAAVFTAMIDAAIKEASDTQEPGK